MAAWLSVIVVLAVIFGLAALILKPGTFDPSYGQQVYFEQGGAGLVVGPSGRLEMNGAITGFMAGNAYYVDSVRGSSANAGTSWGKAKATLVQALALCTADNGDVIFVAPKHAETIVAAAGSGITVAGVRVIGMGTGRQRPTFTFTTDVAASFNITAARSSIENCVFVNGIDAQTAMVNISAADVTFRGCELQTGDATTQTLIGILTTAAADRLRIEGNQLHGLVDAGTTSQIQIVGGDSIVIANNILIGACAATGNIKSLTTASTNMLIAGNFILNQTADGNNLAINLKSDATGLIANNRMAVIDSTSPAPVVAAACYVSGNYWTGAAGVTASTLM